MLVLSRQSYIYIYIYIYKIHIRFRVCGCNRPGGCANEPPSSRLGLPDRNGLAGKGGGSPGERHFSGVELRSCPCRTAISSLAASLRANLALPPASERLPYHQLEVSGLSCFAWTKVPLLRRNSRCRGWDQTHMALCVCDILRAPVSPWLKEKPQGSRNKTILGPPC